MEIGISGAISGSLLAVVNGGVLDFTGPDPTVFVGGTADGTLQIGNGGAAGTVNAETVSLGSAGSKVLFQHTGTTTFAPAITGSGQVQVQGPGITILSGANTYTGATQVLGGTLQAGAADVFGNLSATTVAGGATLDLNGFNQTLGSLAGAGIVTLGAATLTAGGGGTTTTFSGVIGGTGGFTKAGSGTFTLSGANTYNGATTVNAGILSVNGSIAFSSGVTVNSGATLGGTGQLPATVIASGGALAPGNSIGTITVNGNLTFAAGSTYTVEVSPTDADRTNVVGGTATLTGATVQAIALPGSFQSRTYTILNADGGLVGTFGGLNVTGSFSPMRAHLTYDLNNAYLVLEQGTLVLPQGASGNQTSVAGGINNAVNNGAMPPAGFDALLNMSDGALLNALNQISGQPGANTAQVSFQAGNAFLQLLLNPFTDQRGTGFGPATGYAPEPGSVVRDAFARFDGPAADRLARGWSVWGAAYGGAGAISGDANVGSARTSVNAAGFAAGADYRPSRDSLAGVAFAGGGSSWHLDGGLGGGRTDFFQAGVYGSQRFGAAYLSGALAYASHWVTTDRTVTVSGTDKLAADFVAQTFGARVEGGYRLPAGALGAVTPYGAVQVQTYWAPSYSERAVSGANTFALDYGSQTATKTRSELGAFADKTIVTGPAGTLILRGRVAWVHDFNPDAAISAVFQTLPGSNFTVNGAAPAADGALVSAGSEWRLAGGWSVAARFDGEFSRTTALYAGTGSVRYTW
ncbi:MAG: autotransporter domain-containing protein [Xanthobacteraceae bacterium]|nr:autotransporter domain-containing protein [Xanthobacteraceae bacterium]